MSLFGTSAYTVVYNAPTKAFTTMLRYSHPDPSHTTSPRVFVINQDQVADEGFQAYAVNSMQISTLIRVA